MTSYLVDTSAWILSFSSAPPPRLKETLESALHEDRVQTCGMVIAELLQGCRSAKEKTILQDQMMALHYLEWSESDWKLLGETSFHLRSRGATIPLADLIIALLAIRHGSTVLHRDRHFELIAKHLPLSKEKI